MNLDIRISEQQWRNDQNNVLCLKIKNHCRIWVLKSAECEMISENFPRAAIVPEHEEWQVIRKDS